MDSEAVVEDDIRNEAGVFLTIAATSTGLALLFVAARIYSRAISIRRYGVDDYLCLVSITIGLLYLALVSVALTLGGDKHASSLTQAQYGRVLYFTIIAFVPGVLSFTVPKFAVVVLLVKALQPGPFHRTVMWALSVVGWSLGVDALHPRIRWRVFVLVLTGFLVLSVLFDFYLALYPTTVLARLTMNWKKKLALSVSLGFGYCAGAVAIYKCTTLTHLRGQKEFPFALNDIMLQRAQLPSIEANCVLIGACIPTLYPLIVKIFGVTALGGSAPFYPRGRRPPASAAAQRLTSQQVHVLTIGSHSIRKKPVLDDLGSVYGEANESSEAAKDSGSV